MDETQIFESEVRRIAAELFSKSRTTGPIKIDGRERDGVYNEGEIIHVVEATTSHKVQKAKEDLRKSADLVKALRKVAPDVNFKIWFIVKGEPTADQVELVPNVRKDAKCPVEVCGFHVFASKLIDARRYLQIRDNYPFGSVRNPADDRDYKVPEGDYVPIDLIERNEKKLVSIDSLIEKSSSSHNSWIITGDFGAGKSMTMRQIYYGLKRQYLKADTVKLPVYINLRDHFGQTNPAEALIRHGNEIGFPDPNQLVAAWRAGYVHLLLDGFDELSSMRLVRGVSGLRTARRHAVKLVKEIITSQPRSTSIFISGREHYFDSSDELSNALGLPHNTIYLKLNEFTHEQVEKYLQQKGYKQSIPDWLPSRPLLIGYLAVKGMLASQDKDLTKLTQEEGWNYLLDRICEREANQVNSVGVDARAVREFVEKLATQARQTNSGRGPIYLKDIVGVFSKTFDMPPDENTERLIFRMPGFTSVSGQDDALEFIDDDYVDACRAGDVLRYIKSPHDTQAINLYESTTQMKDVGVGLVAIQQSKTTEKQMSACLTTAANNKGGCLVIDLMKIM